jgi:hypothetical protein
LACTLIFLLVGSSVTSETSGMSVISGTAAAANASFRSWNECYYINIYLACIYLVVVFIYWCIVNSNWTNASVNYVIRVRLKMFTIFYSNAPHLIRIEITLLITTPTPSHMSHPFKKSRVLL